MLHIRPHLIHVFLWEVVDSFRLVGCDKLTAPEAALAHSSFARRLVLLKMRSLDQHTTQYTFNSNVVQEVRGEAVIVSYERLFAAQWARLQLRDTRGAKQSTACEAVTRAGAEFCANRTLEFVAHVEIIEILIGLNQNEENLKVAEFVKKNDLTIDNWKAKL